MPLRHCTAVLCKNTFPKSEISASGRLQSRHTIRCLPETCMQSSRKSSVTFPSMALGRNSSRRCRRCSCSPLPTRHHLDPLGLALWWWRGLGDVHSQHPMLQLCCHALCCCVLRQGEGTREPGEGPLLPPHPVHPLLAFLLHHLLLTAHSQAALVHLNTDVVGRQAGRVCGRGCKCVRTCQVIRCMRRVGAAGEWY